MLTLPRRGPRLQQQMRKQRGFFVNSGQMQLALRDLRGEFSHPPTLAALAGVAIVVGISGPFGTLDAFSFLPRMAYWALVVPLTYAAGFLGTMAARPYLPRGHSVLTIARRIALAAFGSALMVALVLGILNTGLGLNLGGPRDIALGFAAVYAICLVIEGVGVVLHSHALAQGRPSTAQTPALLSRLPLEKRGSLLAITAEDHYITVITTKGREMVLMRLADAIAEATPLAGVQIHRSHWVALAGVVSVARLGGATEALLINGDRLPIARARMNDARAAGLLPRRGN